MVYLKTKILFILIIIGLPLLGQSFTYSYIDPCTKQSKFIYADMSAPIVISYYGQIQTFTYTQLSDGTFDTWINNTYTKYQNTSPCQGVLTTTTTTTSTNQVSNIIGNVTSLLSLDLSSITSGVTGGVGSNIGGTTSSGSGSITNNKKKNDNNNSNNNSSNNSSNNSDGSNPSQGTGENGGNSSENQGGSVESGGEGGGAVGGNSNSSNSSNSSSGSSGSGSGSSGSGEGQPQDKPTDKQIEDQKVETQKTSTQASAKAASKAKAETQKPAILVTGDIVGVQTRADGSQDARGTMSFTRVKGDGTSSIGFSADYMVNAKIGNLSAVKSWIGANKKGNKHINVASVGLGILPQSTTGSGLLIRVNSLKNFTALYGVSGTYGQLYGEELISTIAIAGFMYKGKLGKAIDATIIMAGIYSPYSKFYTESIFESKPIVIPFLNLNYKLTKTFGIGLTGGGTYIAGQDILNFQILMGAKLKI
jgi:hypothetical protein